MTVRMIIYASQPTRPRVNDDLSDIDSIIRASYPRNCVDGVSGALYVGDTRFVQVLEGEPDAVEATFTRIAADPRHAKIEILFDGRVNCRCFSDWGMAYIGDTPALRRLYPQERLEAMARRGVADEVLAFMVEVARSQVVDGQRHAVPPVISGVLPVASTVTPAFPTYNAVWNI